MKGALIVKNFKKYQNRIVSVENLIIDIMSSVISIAVFVMSAGVLLGLIEIPVSVTFLGLAFVLINPHLKSFCSDKMSLKADGGYINLSGAVRKTLAEDSSLREFKIFCDGVTEYSFNMFNSCCCVDIDVAYISLLPGGSTMKVVGVKDDKEVYSQIVEF